MLEQIIQWIEIEMFKLVSQSAKIVEVLFEKIWHFRTFRMQKIKIIVTDHHLRQH